MLKSPKFTFLVQTFQRTRFTYSTSEVIKKLTCSHGAPFPTSNLHQKVDSPHYFSKSQKPRNCLNFSFIPYNQSAGNILCTCEVCLECNNSSRLPMSLNQYKSLLPPKLLDYFFLVPSLQLLSPLIYFPHIRQSNILNLYHSCHCHASNHWMAS